MTSQITEHLACPSCLSTLKAVSHNKEASQSKDRSQPKQVIKRLQCDACKISYPILANGVGVFYPKPNAALTDWRNRLSYTFAELEFQLDQTQAAQGNAKSAIAKDRLGTLAHGLTEHIQELKSLMAPLGAQTDIARELHQVLGTQLAAHHGPTSYMPQVFRDWCWGETENNQVLEHLKQVLASAGEIKNILVLGAGAGRLAYDLHCAFDAATVCVDTNPLLCFINQNMAEGKTLTLTEFPLAPHSPNDVAVSAPLQNPNYSPAPSPTNNQTFAVLCADATTLPLQNERFDVVVTPWLIDVIDIPLDKLLGEVNRVLRPGGHWLNHGSIAFSGHPANQLDEGEVREVTQACGFQVEHNDNTPLPYLQSPHSRQQRTEIVYTQLARKTKNYSPSTDQVIWPSWLDHHNEVVPFSDDFKAQLTNVRIHGFVMGLINGERSINDMANVMQEQRLMPKQEAVQVLQGFLKKMVEEAKRTKSS